MSISVRLGIGANSILHLIEGATHGKGMILVQKVEFSMSVGILLGLVVLLATCELEKT